MARFFVPRKSINHQRATVEGPELDHLRKVLRLGPGDSIIVFDDAGWEHEAVIRSLSAQAAEIDVLRSFQAERESPLQLTLAVGLTKGEKMDFVVEKATELGAQAIVPFVSAYTVPKLDQRKIEKRGERWQKIALAAAKQCRRTRIPEIFPLVNFENMVQQTAGPLNLLFWEKEAHQTLKEVHAVDPDARSILLVIGPEGGLSDPEADLAQQHGFKAIRLGRRILRAETAAVAATSLVQYLWGDLG
ncbi:MAG TPA: 16S rRNA (uracil(1498)-N(3))-methyltransferase [Candidatus Binatia bacterium]|nr:16S rRNA (uracil(1498)-N(3))-methyltransferase [Candidatus Binatia bacterium]